MIPDIGNIALAIALAASSIQFITSFWGAQINSAILMDLGLSSSRVQFLFLGGAFLVLALSFFNNDFSVLYVAANSNSLLPLIFKFAAIWGGHEGSMLLWAMILSLWTVIISLFSKSLPAQFKSRIFGTMGLISTGFLSFIFFTSNPFERLIPSAIEGRDLNPLLQDPGMVFHPPVLYMGYVGFSVAFSFAVAALIGGELDKAWAKWTKQWTLLAWIFLTLGIAFGSKWAYYELGWGGWWFWDAVENASFMPWLIGTALIHSLTVTEKRNSFKGWTVFLAILAFALCLLGTFLVRSGVLTSVHAFASDPKRGLFILALFSVIIGGALALFALRAPQLRKGEIFGVVSRESLLLTGNMILMAATSAVMLGTLYPLILDALDLGKISVGPPYFDSVFVPIMSPAILLIGFAIFSKWKKDEISNIAKKLGWCFILSLSGSILIPLMLGSFKPMTSLGLLMSFWIISTSTLHLYKQIKGTKKDSLRSLLGLPRPYIGMMMGHLGLAIFITGVTMVKSYESNVDTSLSIGNQISVGQYTFHFDAVKMIEGPNYIASRGYFSVTKANSSDLIKLFPERREYKAQKSQLTEAAINPGLFRDLYVSMAEQINPTTWAIRVYVKPFANWIWFGCFMMAIGACLSFSDKKYQSRKEG